MINLSKKVDKFTVSNLVRYYRKSLLPSLGFIAIMKMIQAPKNREMAWLPFQNLPMISTVLTMIVAQLGLNGNLDSSKISTM